MGFPILESIPIIGRLFQSTADIIKEVVVDKDKQNEIIGNLEEIGRQLDYQIRIKELETPTIPWVDALHKMGRQILNLATIIGVFAAIALGHQFTQWDVLLIGGPNTAYQLIKGKGGKK